MIDLNNKKLDLTYPCNWSYKVISSSKSLIEEALAEVLINKDFKISPSKSSKSKTYISMQVDIVVVSEEERLGVFEALKSHRHIKFVL